MPRFSKQQRNGFWIASGILSMGFVFSYLFELPIITNMLRGLLSMNDLLDVALLLAVTPPAILYYVERSWQYQIERNIPRFLQQFTESGRSGIEFMRAFELASETRLGPLTKELKKVIGQLSWGVAFERALDSFTRRVDIPFANRISRLILQASQAGAKAQQVLEAINRHAQDVEVIESEKNTAQKPFVLIVYVAMLVFLLVDIILVKQFFEQLLGQKGAAILLVGVPTDFDTIVRISYHLAAITSVFGGLVAGKMGEGSIIDGFKHSAILLVITFIAFHIFVGTG